MDVANQLGSHYHGANDKLSRGPLEPMLPVLKISPMNPPPTLQNRDITAMTTANERWVSCSGPYSQSVQRAHNSRPGAWQAGVSCCVLADPAQAVQDRIRI